MSPRNLTQKVRAIVRLGLMEMFGQKKLPCCSKEAKFFAGGAEVDVGGKRKGVYDGIYFVALVSTFISSPNEGSKLIFLVLRGGLFFGLLLSHVRTLGHCMDLENFSYVSLRYLGSYA